MRHLFYIYEDKLKKIPPIDFIFHLDHFCQRKKHPLLCEEKVFSIGSTSLIMQLVPDNDIS